MATRHEGTIEWNAISPRPPRPRKAEDVESYWASMEAFFEDNMPTTYKGAREWIEVECDSYERVPALLHLHGQIEFGEWLRLLGEFWTKSDNIGPHADDLLWIFREWLDILKRSCPS